MTRFAISATIAGGVASVGLVSCDADCGEEAIDDGFHTRAWLRAERLGEVRLLGDYFGEERHFCSPACAVVALTRAQANERPAPRAV